VLESWYTRNAHEHDTQGDPVLRRKEKISDQILWMKSKVDKTFKNSWSQIEKQDLLKLPIENLNMMLEQIKRMPKER
jgi:hypothetical protein